MFFRKNPYQQLKISHRSPAELSQKKKLIIGCGTIRKINNLAYPYHQDDHPKELWTTLDTNPDFKPDIVADATHLNLKNELQQAKVIPEQGYDVIYSEGIMVYVFDSAQYHKNIFDLVAVDGIVVIDNVAYDDVTKFQETFHNIYSWNEMIVLSKQPLTINQVLDKLQNAGVKNHYFDNLIANLKIAKTICEQFHITDPSVQQLIPAYCYIKKYLDIIGKQNIASLLEVNKEKLNIETLLIEHPEITSILKDKPYIGDLLQDSTLVTTLMFKLEEDAPQKEQILTTLRNSTLDEVAEYLKEAETDTVKHSAQMFLSIVPRAFDVGDSDDLDAFLDWHQSGYDGHHNDKQVFYRKEKIDHVMDCVAKKFEQFFRTENLQDLKSIHDYMDLILKEEFLFNDDMIFNPSIDQAVIEWAYNLEAQFAFKSSFALCKFILNAYKKNSMPIHESSYRCHA